MTQFHRFCVSSLLTLLLCRAAGAEDWPTYMHDNARSGITAEELALPLSLHWQITPPAPHKPAWPGPQKGYREQKKLVFDDSFATVVVGGTVYFGSSVDSRIYAIDAATGKTRWSFATGGAVRLAPSVDSGKVYAGSDDGYAYCLEAESGKLIWQVRAGPDGRMVLGHGRLVSPWPVRTGVTIEDGKAWFGGGIFSFDGVRLHCVDAATGKPIWQEELPSALSYSAQGHWLLDSKRLYTPAGRSVPFAFDKTTGKKLYRVAGGKTGAGFGTYGLLHDDLFISGTQIYLVCYDADTGKMGVRLQPALRAIIARDVMFLLTRDSVRAVKLSVLSDLNAIDSLKISSKEKRAVRVTKMQENTLWKVPGDGFASMIMAGRTLVVGGTGEVIAFDVSASHRATPAPPQVSWKGTVTGAVSGLTAANSVLLASMSDGAIACFGRRAPATEPAPVAAKPAVAEENAALTGRAVALLKEAGAVRGHCLLVGKAAAIAGALAKNSELQVQCSVKNATAAQQLRQALAVQGVYGNRVTVAGDARIQGRYPQYFANIIVVEEGYAQENVASLLKPHGGTLFALAASGEFKLLSRREGLEGAGEWTHQYADPGNSGASTDTALSLPLSLLWYGDPGSNTQQERHSRGPAPLVVGGRVYLQCVAIQTDYRRSPDLNSHYLICFDAYNGVEYWRRELPGANRRYLAWEESNLACDGASLFVAAGDRCYRLDTQTGKTLATYRAPAAKDGSKRLWSYVAVSEGVLVGSTTKTSIFRWMTVKTESYQDLFSDALFAFDITTGKQLWHHRGANIKKNATAISEGMVFLADAGAVDEKRGASLWEEQLDVMAHKTMDRKGNPIRKIERVPEIYQVRALDLKTGNVNWQKQLDLTHCGGDLLATLASRGALVIGGNYSTALHYRRNHTRGHFSNRRLLVLNAKDGSLRWDKKTNHLFRPLIINDRIIAAPFAFDLETGDRRMIQATHKGKARERVWTCSIGGCGIISGSPHALFGRAGSSGYLDHRSDAPEQVRMHGTRPGCWINMIPAAGLMVETEAASGCACLFPVQCTTVFVGPQ